MGHRPQRLPDIKQTQNVMKRGRCYLTCIHLHVTTGSKHNALIQCYIIVGPCPIVFDAGPTLIQHWINSSCINTTLGKRLVFAGNHVGLMIMMSQTVTQR